MNLEESNSFVEEMERNNRNKRKILVAIIVLLFVVGMLLFAVSYLKKQDALKLKMFIDEKQVPISSSLILEENGENYVNIKELASMLGYSYQKGEYKNYTEDTNSCYLRTPYEIVSISADSETATKYILNENYVEEDTEDTNTTSQSNVTVENSVETDLITENDETGEQTINIVVDSKNETQETFYLKEPVKYINKELYVSFSELPRLFNISLNLEETNRIRIYSLNYLINSATQIASQLGYKKVSNIYENLTTMADGMLVVGDENNYGVVSLTNGQEIISLKYEKIVYMQNTEEFLVSAENSVGIVSAEGKTIIKPTEYDTISVLDELNKLYLVKKDDKYGVLNGVGETVVYAEYDSIGLSSRDIKNFQDEDVRNFNLLFDKCIPVEKDGKFGLIDLEGNECLRCVYDSLGYIANSNKVDKDKDKDKNNDDDDEYSNNTSANNTVVNNSSIDSDFDSVLTIPERVGIKGIVIKINGLYGLFDAQINGLLIPCTYNKIYSKTKSGVTTYYLEYNGKEIELEEFLDMQDLKTIKTSSDKKSKNDDEFSKEEENEENTEKNNDESDEE